MKKKAIIILTIILILIFIFLEMFIGNNLNISLRNNYSKSYEEALLKIEEGNEYIIKEDLTDGCFPYRKFHRGCYYSDEKHYATNTIPNQQNLSHEEVISLCYAFVHRGATAYCLKSNSEKQECLNFAGTNNYLIRICNLDEGEIIPSQMMGPYETDMGGYNVDSWKTIEPVKYSDLE